MTDAGKRPRKTMRMTVRDDELVIRIEAMNIALREEAAEAVAAERARIRAGVEGLPWTMFNEPDGGGGRLIGQDAVLAIIAEAAP